MVEGRCFYRIDEWKEETTEWIRNKQVNIEPSWLGIWGLAEWIYFGSGQADHLQGCQNYLSFGLLIRTPGEEAAFGLRNLYQHYDDDNGDNSDNDKYDVDAFDSNMWL